MALPTGTSQSRQWGDLPSRASTQVMVQGADLLVPMCHREEFPWPLCTQPLLVQPQMGKAPAVLCCAEGVAQADVVKGALIPLGTMNMEDKLGDWHWVLCRSSYENSPLHLCLRDSCPGCFSLPFPAMSITTRAGHFP